MWVLDGNRSPARRPAQRTQPPYILRGSSDFRSESPSREVSRLRAKAASPPPPPAEPEPSEPPPVPEPPEPPPLELLQARVEQLTRFLADEEAEREEEE